MKSWSKLLASLTVAGLLASTAAQAGEPKSGGTLAVVEPAGFASAQPQSRANIQVANARYQLIDQLIQLDPETGLARPWLAESWTVSPDGLVYEFKLRPGVTHSDGTPVNAENVKRNLDQFAFGDEARRLPKTPVLSSYARTEIVDDLTFRIHLSAPNSGLFEYLGMPELGIHANAYLDLDVEGQSTFKNVIGSGPFVVLEYAENEQLVLGRREGYAWTYDGSTNPGEAYLERVVFRFAPDATARAGLVASGQADLARAISPIDEQYVSSSGAQIVQANPKTGAAAIIYLRPTNERISDLNVRRALLLGYDPAALIRDGLTPSYIPATSFAPAGSLGHIDVSDRYSYDPAEAARLLDESGWKPGPDGIRVKDGQRLTLVIAVAPSSVGSTTGKRYFELLAQQYEQIGIELDLSTVGSPTFWAETSRDPAVPLSALRTPFAAYNRILSSDSDYLGLKGSDPKLETLLTAAIEAPSEAGRAEALGEVQRYLIDNVYYLPLYDDPQVYAASARSRDVRFNAYGHPDLQQLWVE